MSAPTVDRPRPRQRRDDGTPARPRLREQRPADASERLPRKVAVVVAVVFAVLFCAAALQVLLIGNQRRLDQLNNSIADAQTAQDELRRRESQLRSPSEIVRIARDELGMVRAPTPVLVTPPPQIVGLPVGAPGSVSGPSTTVAPSTTVRPSTTVPPSTTLPRGPAGPTSGEPSR